MRISSIALLACFPLALVACDDPMAEDGDTFGADSGTISQPDAAPVLPDAAPPVDAPPEDVGEDFPIELACSLEEVQPIFECVTENCLESIQDGNLLTCVTLSCGLLFLTLPPECTQCVLAGLSDPSMALDSCVLGLDDLGLPPAP